MFSILSFLLQDAVFFLYEIFSMLHETFSYCIFISLYYLCTQIVILHKK